MADFIGQLFSFVFIISVKISITQTLFKTYENSKKKKTSDLKVLYKNKNLNDPTAIRIYS